MSRPHGPCSICSVVGPLTFEHIPPESAFNAQTMRVAGFEEAMRVHPLDMIKGKQQQRGFGGHTLCEGCNSKTGDWYVKEYAWWAWQAHELLVRADNDPTLTYIYHGFPLRFIKQAITILFSASGTGLATAEPDLVRLVLDRRRRYLPTGLRLFAYYNPSPKVRCHPVQVQLDINTGAYNMFVEFAAYPFGLVLCDNSPPPDERLTDITWLAEFGHDDFRHVPLKLPSFPVVAPFGGSYITPAVASVMRKPGGLAHLVVNDRDGHRLGLVGGNNDEPSTPQQPS